ncbi:hypothetical protein GUITHDRAFT_107512 [Guillardia theta CCMP2712]|uniref:Uncharacterized protein n=1 Tax=Guillardia theta (strain CCMP2712) TaxID=905079 RepID=L1JDZ1_GUITC|nr:hypothetical protein GUITHDRAFT_107508 [Guillardia theta CCMP2712]XP_005833715.1 hypothetical protein GUITHDRAFT_107512 [Guillardia theta CCMP2712]EKX46731.1 hypothetical protein GUITHDRAFT_107508 [Guillardia theta CCMP2712]EKX46735.1 hypothetical protein GUITHDRAFT_107512 [Guillardia theta CCMP2712]|eukprot:XP_005833711.1 hypothetical protein GUITHDRAFT_107508 [Guillardia theta CCMP2712]
MVPSGATSPGLKNAAMRSLSLSSASVGGASTQFGVYSGFDDTPFCSHKWVFCTETSRNLTTGAYNRQCFGTVSKANWTDPLTRFDSCKSAILNDAPSSSTMIPIRICTLDSTMNELCIKVADFLQRIQAAKRLQGGGELQGPALPLHALKRPDIPMSGAKTTSVMGN